MLNYCAINFNRNGEDKNSYTTTVNLDFDFLNEFESLKL